MFRCGWVRLLCAIFSIWRKNQFPKLFEVKNVIERMKYAKKMFFFLSEAINNANPSILSIEYKMILKKMKFKKIAQLEWHRQEMPRSIVSIISIILNELKKKKSEDELLSFQARCGFSNSSICSTLKEWKMWIKK